MEEGVNDPIYLLNKGITKTPSQRLATRNTSSTNGARMNESGKEVNPPGRDFH